MLRKLLESEYTWFVSVIGGGLTIVLDTNDIFGTFNYEGITITLFVLGAISFITSEVYGLKELFEKKSKEIEGYIRHQYRVLLRNTRANQEQLKIAASNGSFLQVEAVDALNYLSQNLNRTKKLYNIRIRPNDKLPKKMKDAGTRWRKEIKNIIESDGDIEILEIISDDFLIESGELIQICEGNTCQKVDYHCKHIPSKAENLQIRNFTLVEVEHPKETRLELYWGWDLRKGNATKFYTYYTSDKIMTLDYLNRFDKMFQKAQEINEVSAPPEK